MALPKISVPLFDLPNLSAQLMSSFIFDACITWTDEEKTLWIENKVKGKMLMMSSVRGRHGNYSGYTAYCTSKGATDALTRVLATEWARHGITVNAIAPTVFRSKLTEWMWSDDEVGQATRKRSLSRIPLGRLGEPEDLVGMALYLLSPASDFCTGQIMYVDGGYTAG